MGVVFSSYWNQETVDVLLSELLTQINRLDTDDKTALMWSSKEGRIENVKALLQRGADANIKNRRHQTALMYASSKGYTNCVETLLQSNAGVNFYDLNGMTALMIASCGGYSTCVEALLLGGANIDFEDPNYNNTALIIAALNGYVDCLRILLEWGADADIKRTDTGMTALMEASKEGHIECVRALLRGGAKVNIKDNNGKTALMLASEKGHIKCVETLLQWGAKVNIKDKMFGWTAEMYAKDYIVKNLLQNPPPPALETIATPEVPQMRGGGKTAACCGRLLSKAFRKDKLDCPLWYGVEGTEILSGKPLAPQQDFEVDHIIGLEMVSEAFSDVFKKQSLETCLQVICEMGPIIHGEDNLCHVPKDLNQNKKSPSNNASVLKYMEEVKKAKLMHCAISEILNIFITEPDPDLQAVTERFAKRLVGLLKRNYPALTLDLNVKELKDEDVQSNNREHRSQVGIQ